MSIQPQTVSVPLYGGIDTKTDVKYVPPTSGLQAQNVQYFGIKRARKRYGQTALSQNIGNTGAQITVGAALGIFNNEMLAYDGTNVYGYAQSQNTWYSKGPVTEVSTSTAPIIRSAGTVAGIASALAATLEVYAWEDSRGGVYYAVRDPLSGTFSIAAQQLDASATNPQIVLSGQFVYIFYNSLGTIKAAQFSASNASAGIQTTYTISNDAVPATAFAVAVNGTNTAIAWQGGAGGFWYAGLFTAGLTPSVLTIQAFAPSAGYLASMTYSSNGTNLLLMVSGGTTVTFYPIDPTTAAWGTPINHTVSQARAVVGVPLNTSPNVIQTYWDTGAGGAMPGLTAALVGFVGTTTIALGATTVTYGLQIASQPVLYAGAPYIVAASALVNRASAQSQQTSFYLLKGTAPAVTIQRFSGDVAAVSGLSTPQLLVSGNQLFIGLGQKTQLLASATGTVYSQVGITACYFTFPTASNFKVGSFNNTAIITCGNTYTYDGSAIVESGFWEFPDGISSSVQMVAGPSLNQGQYTYQVTYEWVDAAGNNHYSAPSYPVVAQTTNAMQTNAVTLVIPYTALTFKPDAVVCVYRSATAPNSPSTTATGLSPLYKVFSTPNKTDGTPSFTFQDTIPDSALISQVQLYAPFDGSGELENNPPPPFSYMVATKTRVFGIAQDDPTALWYSKPLAPNRPAQFSELQIIRIETAGGAITGLGYQDILAVIFKADRIYYLPGDGPNAAGKGNLYGTPQQISSTSGCISSQSILNTLEGVWFKSKIGIQVLESNLQINSNIGFPVQGLNSLSITGAQPRPDQNQLLWTSSNGTALVYDYAVGKWSTNTNYDAVGYVQWNGTYARLRSTGQVLYEDQSTFLDNNQPITMLIETAWLQLSSMAQGYSAIWYAEVLGQYFSPHFLVTEIAYDYIDVPAQVAVWNATLGAADTATWGSSKTWGSDVVWGSNTYVYTTPYQLRIALQRQVCQSVKFKIYDSGITGQSCDLNEIALQLGVIGGLNRVPTKQQV